MTNKHTVDDRGMITEKTDDSITRLDLNCQVKIGDGANPSLFRGGCYLPITSVTGSAYTVKKTDYLVEVDTTVSASTIQLPSISSLGIPTGFIFPVIVKDGKTNAAINNITIAAYTSESIDRTSSVINTNRGAISLYARSGSIIWETMP